MSYKLVKLNMAHNKVQGLALDLLVPHWKIDLQSCQQVAPEPIFNLNRKAHRMLKTAILQFLAQLLKKRRGRKVNFLEPRSLQEQQVSRRSTKILDSKECLAFSGAIQDNQQCQLFHIRRTTRTKQDNLFPNSSTYINSIWYMNVSLPIIFQFDNHKGCYLNISYHGNNLTGRYYRQNNRG